MNNGPITGRLQSALERGQIRDVDFHVGLIIWTGKKASAPRDINNADKTSDGSK